MSHDGYRAVPRRNFFWWWVICLGLALSVLGFPFLESSKPSWAYVKGCVLVTVDVTSRPAQTESQLKNLAFVLQEDGWSSRLRGDAADFRVFVSETELGNLVVTSRVGSSGAPSILFVSDRPSEIADYLLEFVSFMKAEGNCRRVSS